MNSKTILIHGKSFYLVDEGDGPALLFVHGFPLDHSMWVHQIEALSRRYRVICPDLPGFGSSDSLEVDFTMRAVASHLSNLLDHLEIPEVAFCGLSMGGYIGWEFAANHADRLTALVACNTRAANDSEQVARARRMVASSVIKTGSEVIAEDMVKKLLAPNSDPALQKAVFESISQTEPASIANGQLGMSQRQDAIPWLPAISVPTLFIAGELDQITPPDEMKSNAELVPSARMVTIENAGHLSPMEQPDQFNTTLESFLME